MKHDNIVLVGFMGTGKTTVSQALVAELQGWTAVDTDLFIERQEGMAIPEIFARRGETYFRQAESRVIAEVMQHTRQVVATGGGAVLAEANRKWMTRNGFVVALTAAAETIIERVRRDENRPLLHGDVAERVHKLLQQRKNAYDFADIKIDTTGLTVEQVVRLILRERASAAPAP